MNKDALRRVYLDRRTALTPDEFVVLQDRLIKQVVQVDWGKYKMIHIFLPIAGFKEVDTLVMIQYLHKEYPELQLCVPRTNFKARQMEHVRFEIESSILKKNRLGIPEPIQGELIPDEQIDLVFVPLLAFDKKGNRVGYGKGFYDRFLAQCHPNTQKMGLSFFGPIDEISDVDPWDVKLDSCICPDQIWTF